MKRIAAVQDISCVGRCSLTVALPIISAMGVEACPLPTALLSSHTLFPDPTKYDLTLEENRRNVRRDLHGIFRLGQTA